MTHRPAISVVLFLKITHKGFSTNCQTYENSFKGYRKPAISWIQHKIVVKTCFNNWLQSLPTRYRLQALTIQCFTETGYRISLVHSTVDLGAGRQQVSTNMASTDRLQSLQITRSVYRLYSLVFTKTGYRVITSTTGYRAYRPGTGYIQPCFTETGYRVYPPSPFNSVDSGAGRCGSFDKKLLQPTSYRVCRPAAGLQSPYFDSSLPVFCCLQRITSYRENNFYKLNIYQ